MPPPTNVLKFKDATVLQEQLVKESRPLLQDNVLLEEVQQLVEIEKMRATNLTVSNSIYPKSYVKAHQLEKKSLATLGNHVHFEHDGKGGLDYGNY